MSFDFGLPSSSAMAQIGYSMGADLVARLDAARHQRDLSAALHYSEAITEDLRRQNAQLTNRVASLVAKNNALVEEFNELLANAKKIQTTRNELSDRLESERTQAQKVNEHVKSLEKGNSVLLARAHRNGAEAFAANFILESLVIEITNSGQAAKYKSLSPEWQTQAGSWAYVVFINTDRRNTSPSHFPTPGTEPPSVLKNFDWTVPSAAANTWRPQRLWKLAGIEARPEILMAAIESPDTFDAIRRTVVPQVNPK